jgi:hypothetical protein
MKLRQKLAAVLATAMIMTSVPVVTMASSDNSLTHGIIVGKEDDVVNAGSLKIEMDDVVDTTGSMFFVNLENAEWTPVDTTKTVDGVKIDYKTNGKKELQVTVAAVTDTAKADFTLPLDVTLTGGDATVAIDGNGTVISDMSPVVFAKTSEAKANVTADDAEAIYESGQVADITIEESLKGTLTSSADAKDRTIKLTLKNSDFDFSDSLATIKSKIKLSKGFSSLSAADIDAIEVNFGNGGSDKQVIEVKLPQKAASALSAPGRIEIENLSVKADDPTLGDVNIQVEGNKVNKTTVKVAEVKNFGNALEMEDEKAVEIVAGQKDEITFSLNETVGDSIMSGREVEVSLDKAFLSNTNADDQEINMTVKLNDTQISGTDLEALNITPITDDDDYITGFRFTTPNLDASDTNEITFEDVEVFVPLTTEGDVTLTAEGRALVEESSLTAITVKAPVEVTTEAMTLKVGLKDQKGGKITVKETDADMLATEDLVIELPVENGLTFSSTKPVVKVTEGDLVVGEWKIKDNQLIIDVKRASSEASTIEISDLVVSTDRTVPEGTYDINVKGEALVKEANLFLDGDDADDDKNAFEVEDFIVIGTPNTEDLGENGLKKGTAVFTIGNKNYTMNGKTAEMDGTPYISNGRTMVPVRYVANALGVSNTDIYFSGGTVTVVAGNKTVSMEVGSKIARLNGVAARTMETAPVIKDGRTYVPVSEIGALLGVSATWDEAAKTATFENK